MKWFFVLFVIFLAGCGQNRKAKDARLSEFEMLEQKYSAWVDETTSAVEPESGWYVYEICDAMLFNGLWASSPRIYVGDIAATEFTETPGRFGRRPGPRCWTPENGDQGSKTTWSRDMAKGLMIWSYRDGDRGVLQRHAEYGTQNNWSMGEPFADGRSVYSPSTIGELYSVIHAMGGPDNVNRIWPSVYSSGLNDFQAHLQMLSIYLRGSIAEKFNDADALPRKPDDEKPMALLDVSETMYERIVEHSTREPMCPFYEYMRAIYADGDLDRASELVRSDDWSCEYMRAEPRTREAIQIFVAGLILERVGRD